MKLRPRRGTEWPVPVDEPDSLYIDPDPVEKLWEVTTTKGFVNAIAQFATEEEAHEWVRNLVLESDTIACVIVNGRHYLSVSALGSLTVRWTRVEHSPHGLPYLPEILYRQR